MTLYCKKIVTILVLIAFAGLSFAQANLRWKAMNFDNPGSKRLLKTTTGSFFYYRSLPEKTMLINVPDITSIEIRAFSKVKLSKAAFYLVYSGKKTAFELKLSKTDSLKNMFEPVRVTLPPGVKKLELLCYDRNIYFRAFEPIQIQKKKPVPSLKISSFLAQVTLANHSHQNTYYSFNTAKSLSFQVKNGKECHLFLRAQITDKNAPVLGIYKDGVLLAKHILSTKRTNTYKVEGFKHLSIGKKIVLPGLEKTAVYEIRALSNHVFIAKPVIKK